MSIEKLLSLITSSSLYLTRLDKFKDNWEGKWPKEVIQRFEHDNSHLGFHKDGFIDLTEDLRKHFFVCCWHESTHESAALWDLYSGKSGAAIRTTVGQLASASNRSNELEIGRAIYVDFEDKSTRLDLNMLVAPFIKRKSFEHEKEVRLLFWDSGNSLPDDCGGETFSIDLNALISEIRIAPNSDPWIRVTVEKICRKFDLSSPVTQSSLYSDHIY